MRRVIVSAMVAALAIVALGAPVAAVENKVGVGVSKWTSDMDTNFFGGIFPIGGAGQVNGEFTRAKHKGVQIAARILERGEGTIVPIKNGTMGIYKVPAGDGGGGLAEWNLDIHIDLRNAKDQYKNKTLEDYKLVVRSKTDGSWQGCAFPCDLAKIGFRWTRFYQTSQNPVFFNEEFNVTKKKDWRFQVTLVPKTFDAPKLNVVVKAGVKNLD